MKYKEHTGKKNKFYVPLIDCSILCFSCGLKISFIHSCQFIPVIIIYVYIPVIIIYVYIHYQVCLIYTYEENWKVSFLEVTVNSFTCTFCLYMQSCYKHVVNGTRIIVKCFYTLKLLNILHWRICCTSFYRYLLQKWKNE